jgi:hypothetical protein
MGFATTSGTAAIWKEIVATTEDEDGGNQYIVLVGQLPRARIVAFARASRTARNGKELVARTERPRKSGHRPEGGTVDG